MAVDTGLLNSMYNSTLNESITKAIEDRPLIDPKLDNSIAQLRKTMIEAFEPNKLASQTSFRGVCLLQLPSLQEADKRKLRIKARIPELHTLMPLPESTTDYIRIMGYPTFVSEGVGHNADGEFPPDEMILPGAEVLLTFGDTKNFTQPKLIKVLNPFIKEGYGEEEKAARSAAGGDGLGGRPGTVGPDGQVIPRPNNLGTSGQQKPAHPITDGAVGGAGGWIKKAPHFNSAPMANRKTGDLLDTIVFHEACMPGEQGTINTLEKKGAGTHFGITPWGKTTQYVDIYNRTGHVGTEYVNSRSIGIDLIMSLRLMSKAKYFKKYPGAPKLGPGWPWNVEGKHAEAIKAAAMKMAKRNNLKDPKSQLGYFERGWADQFILANRQVYEKAYALVKAIIAKHPKMKLKFPAASGNTWTYTSNGQGAFNVKNTGIIAHSNVQANRLDGNFSTYYIYLRAKRGMSSTNAYAALKGMIKHINKNGGARSVPIGTKG